jgi:hypothetical protein
MCKEQLKSIAKIKRIFEMQKINFAISEKNCTFALCK